MSNKLHWAKWFWSDWAGDAALNLCSIPARGLWMALLCLAAQGDPYGTVTIKGRAPTNDELFKLIAPRGTRRGDFDRWLAELERAGVAQRDREGVICSTRMKHDGALHAARAEAARKKWEKADIADILHKQKSSESGDLHMQTDSCASIEPSPTRNTESPLSPRKRGVRGRGADNGARKTSRNAHEDMLREEFDAETDDARPRSAPVVPFPGRIIRS